MNNKNIAMTVLLCLALFGAGFLLGFVSGGKFYSRIYTDVREGAKNIDGVTKDVAQMKQPGMPPPPETNDPEELGAYYWRNGDPARAAGYYGKAAKAKPGNIDILNEYGMALAESGQYKEAVEVLKEGADANPEHQRIQLSCGFALLSEGRGTEALKYFERARAIDPGNDIGKEAERLINEAKKGKAAGQ